MVRERLRVLEQRINNHPKLNEGDKVLVKCIGIDKQGKIKLSRKEALGQKMPEGE